MFVIAISIYFTDPEVHEVDFSGLVILAKHDVLWFEVTMNDTFDMNSF